MALKKLKYPYLYAWDRVMGSFQSWSERMQREAEATNAPLDALHQKTGDSKEGWVRYSDLQRFDVKHDVWKRVTDMGYDAGPEPTEDDFRVEIEGRDCTQSEAEKINEINRLVKEWIEYASCGEVPCDTCDVGVAIGVKALDDAFNKGYRMGAADERNKQKEV